MPRDLLILCYHAVSTGWPADLSLTPEDFQRQVAGLIESGYVPMTLTDSREASRPAKALVITFDDGYLSTLAVAAPILDRLGAPATLFVPTDYIGLDGPMSWPGIDQWEQGPHRDELRPLDWSQVRELDARGWEIGSHTCSHPKLTQITDEQLDEELRRSREIVADELGKSCQTIAYPYGDVDSRVTAAAREVGYGLGVGLPARWRNDTDPLQLPRVGLYHGQPHSKFRLKTSPLARRARLLVGR